MRYSAILFDLDGTLVDSVPDIANSINAMLKDMAYATLSTERISTFLGKGMDHLIWLSLLEVNQGIDPNLDKYERGRKLFAKHYHHQLQSSVSTVFPGVLDGLEQFKAAGCKLAIVTNKPSQFVPNLIQQMGLDSYFELIVGGDSCAEKKPHPMPFLYACEQLGVPPNQALVIGDSINDSQAARKAKIDVLIVPYGYNEGKDVQSLDCDGIVSSMVEAVQWANRPTK